MKKEEIWCWEGEKGEFKTEAAQAYISSRYLEPYSEFQQIPFKVSHAFALKPMQNELKFNVLVELTYLKF